MLTPLQPTSLNERIVFEREKVARKRDVQSVAKGPSSTTQPIKRCLDSRDFPILSRDDENVSPPTTFSRTTPIHREPYAGLHYTPVEIHHGRIVLAPANEVKIKSCLKPASMEPGSRNLPANPPKRKRTVSFSDINERLLIPARSDCHAEPRHHNGDSTNTTTFENSVPRPLQLIPQEVSLQGSKFSSITFEGRHEINPGIPVRWFSESGPAVMLKGGNERIFRDMEPGTEIDIIISWPGYNFALERSTSLSKSRKETMTRDHLLFTIIECISDYVGKVLSKQIRIDPLQTKWSLSGGLQVEDLVITRLIHCGGTRWLPEIWAPV